MAQDFASLGIRVDSDDVLKGTEALDDLAEAAERAEGAAQSAGAGFSEAGDAVGKVAEGGRTAAEVLQSSGEAARTAATATADVAQAGGRAAEVLQATGKAAKTAADATSTYADEHARITDLFVKGAIDSAQYVEMLDKIPREMEEVAESTGGAATAVQTLTRGLPLAVIGIGAAVAAGGLLAKVFFEAQKESSNLANSLVLSGNAAGTTFSQLNAMAEGIDRIVGTQVEASAVLAQLAGSGKVAVGQLQGAAQLALQLERSAGIASGETVKNFIALGEKPAQVIRELNSRYNFLTADIYKQIRALEDQGRVAEAAALAQDTYLQAMSQRAGDAEENLGTLQRAARATTGFFKEMWDAVLDIGRPASSLEQKLAAVEDVLRRAQEDPGARINVAAAQRRRDELLKQLEPERTAAKERADAAAAEAKAIEDAAKAADEAKRKQAKAQSDAAALDKALRAANLADIKRSIDAELAVYGDREAVLNAQHAAGLMTEEAYYTERRRLIQEGAAAQVAALQAENEALRASGGSQLERLANLQKVKDNEAAIARLHAETATQLTVLETAESGRLKALATGYRQAEQAATDYLATLQQQYDRELAGQFAGTQQRSRDSGRNAIEDRYAEQRRQLANDQADSSRALPEDVYAQRLALIDRSLAEELRMYDEHWERLRAGEADWRNGAAEAARNYIDETENVAKSTETIVGNFLQGAEDAWVKFVQTGKLSFRDLATSVIADLARINARGLLTQLVGLFGFGGTSGIAAATGYLPIGGTMAAALGAAFGSGGVRAFAKGGAFTNQIIDSPTLFRFANGGIGEMGESGPEAIMPLTRTAGGRLGVSAVGGGGVSVTIQNYGTGKQWDVQQLSQDEVRIIARDEVESRAPNLIAAHLDNPNSRISKSLSRNTTAGRQR